MRVFHTSVNWWILTGVWVTASLFKSPGFLSVFWPIPMMFSFWIVTTYRFISKSFGDCTEHINYNWYHSHFHVPWFFQFSCTFRFPSILSWGQPERQSPLISGVLFVCLLSLGLVVRPRFGDPFVSQNPWGVSSSHFTGKILGCAYTICSYGHI